MTRDKQTNPRHPLGSLLSIIRDLRLAWWLFVDKRVAVWAKTIPVLSLCYLIWPIDLLADPILGLGQLDDLAVIALGVKLFISVCSPDLVQQHRQRIAAAPSENESTSDEVIDTTYRVIDDNGPH